MENIPVLYYDGQSSTAREAILNLKPDVWVIAYTDSDSVHQTSLWRVDDLQQAEAVNEVQIFRYGNFPQQVIECRSVDLVGIAKRQYPYARVFNSGSLVLKGWKNIAAATIVLILLVASIYWYVLPAATEYLAGKIPLEIETEWGESMRNSFVSGSEKDEELSLLVNQFAKGIDFKTSYPINIIVVKDKTVNAFALPGGYIVVFDGILDKMKQPEELAALLAHEVAHIEYKHSLKSVTKSLSGYLFISLVFNDINGISTILVDNANTLTNLSYSRKLESDADIRALETLESNKISQQGMVGLFERLNSPGNYSYLKFLSSHPLTTERIAHAKKWAGKQRKVTAKPKMQILWSKIKARTDED